MLNKRIFKQTMGLAWLTAALSVASPCMAQSADPPSRVARINAIEGQASVQLAGEDDWTSDVINRPLTTGDKVWVDNSSRAEMHVGSTALRLGDQTGVELLNLSDTLTQLRLSAGSMSVRVRSLANDENIEVDLPNASVALNQPGEYRIDVNDNGDVANVAVISGQAEVSTPQQSYRVDPRQRGTFSGVDAIDVDVGDIQGPDALDLWAEQRDAREDQSRSAQYVSRDVPGYQDLDEYGSWDTDPVYGPVWQPRVVAGWAPYHSGHWVWISPWGWTWVDDAPWGFAPFHYGRWVHRRDAWCWSPGQRVVRPVYAPALVAWVGGSHFGVGVASGGGVGWFPLGYNEVYRPGYRVSDRYIRNVNVTNTYINKTTVINNTTVNNITYINQRVPGAVAAVPHDTFVSARPVGRSLIRMDQREIAAARATNTVAIAPTARSFERTPAQSGHVARAVAPRQSVFARPVVSRRAPPPAPATIEAQRQAVIANGARPVPTQSIPRPIQVIRNAPVRVVSPNPTPVALMPAGRGAVSRPGTVERLPREERMNNGVRNNGGDANSGANVNNGGNRNSAGRGTFSVYHSPNAAPPARVPNQSAAPPSAAPEPVKRPDRPQSAEPAVQSSPSPSDRQREQNDRFVPRDDMQRRRAQQAGDDAEQRGAVQMQREQAVQRQQESNQQRNQQMQQRAEAARQQQMQQRAQRTEQVQERQRQAPVPQERPAPAPRPAVERAPPPSPPAQKSDAPQAKPVPERGDRRGAQGIQR